MARYSRRHYRAVSPPADTPADIQARLIRQRALELARQDREREFPVVTPENFNRANSHQEERYAFHVSMLSDGARPNWGRSRADVERLVKSYVAWNPSKPETVEFLNRVIDRVAETGEAVWHASAQVTGHECHCTPCCLGRGEQPVRL